jgi:hypothetical protein
MSQTGFFRLTGLAGDIDIAGRIVTHQYHSQTGDKSLLAQLHRMVPDAFAQALGRSTAIDKSRGHSGLRFPIGQDRRNAYSDGHSIDLRCSASRQLARNAESGSRCSAERSDDVPPSVTQ